ncbi:MAG: serine hydrolase domain-containing protein [Spirochaetota bacterium]
MRTPTAATPLLRVLRIAACTGIAILSLRCSTFKQDHTAVNAVPADTSFADAIRGLDTAMTEAMSRFQLRAAAVAVVNTDGVLYAKTWGQRTVNGGAVDDRTHFRLGSISKTLTAIGIMRLVEQKKLALDDAITDHLPGMVLRDTSGKPVRITVRALLSHHAGVTSDLYDGLVGCSETRSESMSSISRRPLCFQPGTAMKYSNIGYMILGLLIERISGRTFEDYMRDEVLRPIGMGRASYRFSDDIASNSVMPWLDDGTPIPQYAIRDVPAGNCSATLSDLAAYLSWLVAAGERPGPIRASSLSETMREQYPDTADHVYINARLGLSWFLDYYRFPPDFDYGQVSHAGALNGFENEIVFNPEEGIGIVVLTAENSAELDKGEVAKMWVVGNTFGKFLTAQKKRNTLRAATKRERVRTHRPFNVVYRPPAEGMYALFGIAMNVRRTGMLHSVQLAGYELSLAAGSNGIFAPRYHFLCIPLDPAPFIGADGLTMGFTEEHGAEHLAVHWRFGTSTFMNMAERVKPYAIPDAWKKRIGEWQLIRGERIDNFMCVYLPRTKRFVCELRNGFLLIRPEPSRLEFILTPENDSRAVIAGTGERLLIEDGIADFMGLQFRLPGR